jgi:hypothetical protein
MTFDTYSLALGPISFNEIDSARTVSLHRPTEGGSVHPMFRSHSCQVGFL